MNLGLERQIIQPEIPFQYVEERTLELVLPDQDLLNALYGDNMVQIDDAVWNYDARNYHCDLPRSAGEHNVERAMSHIVIPCFCGKAKPWKPNYFYRFGLLYQHYIQLARGDWPDNPESGESFDRNGNLKQGDGITYENRSH